MTVIALVVKQPSEPEKSTFVVRFEARKRKAEIPMTVDFQGKDKMRLIATVQNVQVFDASPIRISIWHKNKPLQARWPIAVNVIGQPHIAPKSQVKSGTSVTRPKAKSAKRKKN
jgi:hypothetical protein